MNLDVWYLNTKAPHKIIALGAHRPDHTLYIFRLIILVSCLNSVSYFLNYVYLIWRHEVVGEVVELGSEVKKFRVGDMVGVGCIVGSCGECFSCKSNIEQYCNNRIFTYNGTYKDGRPTQGGFSSAMVVHQKYVQAANYSYCYS